MLTMNPATGLMEDDGQPDPLAMPNVLPPVNASGGGGAPAPAAPASALTLNYPARPEEVNVASTERRLPTAAGQAADAALGAAQTKELGAIDDVAAANSNEDNARRQALDEKAARLEAQQQEEFVAQAAIDQAKAQGQEEDDRLLKKSLDAKRAAGSANEDFLKTKPGGAFLAAVLRGIDRVASSFRGETGPTGSDRILSEAVDAHEKKLIAEYNASEEARKAHKENRAKYEAGLAQVKAQAANQALHDLQVIDLRLDSTLAGLTPAKRAAEAGKAKAELEAKIAEQRAKREENRDIVIKNARTLNSPTANPANASLEYRKSEDLKGRTVRDPVTGEEIGHADTEQLAKQITTNGSTLVEINTQLRRLGDISKTVPSPMKEGGKNLIGNTVDTVVGKFDGKTQALNQEANTIREGILSQFTQMNGAGAPSESERKGMTAALQTALAQSPESFDRAMRGIQKTLLDRWHAKLPGMGVTQVKAGKSGANPDATLPTREAAAKPAAKPAPAAAPAAGPKEGEIVTHGGKTYVIKGGKAVPQ